MPRYFIEVAYKGTRYSGFQVQENAATIQAEVETALQTIHRVAVPLTGSSRTDAGVHALQNFFHFDIDSDLHPQAVYKLNAILPRDIAVKGIYPVAPDAHSRFDAVSRQYTYRLHQSKNPFLDGLSFYYPFSVDLNLLQEGAQRILSQQDFSAFCKTNTQVKNFNCTIYQSDWREEGNQLVYRIEGNRFLRGMVRLLTATLLKLGRQKLTRKELESLLSSTGKTVFSVPAHGLYLERVKYKEQFSPH